MQQDVGFQPPDADHVVVSVNPKAGSRSPQARVDVLVRLLRERGFQTEVSSDLGEVAQLATHWHAQRRLRALVGVGGDGTAAELVNRTTAGLPITLLPAGNENLLARYLRLGKSPKDLCRTIAEGAVLRLDAGRAGGRIFLLMMGCGFDAEVVRVVHARRKGHIRTRHYFKPILDVIRKYQYPELRVYFDEEGSQGGGTPALATGCRWLFVFNLPCYGGGLRLAPQATGTDGLLDVCAFRRGSFWHGLRYAAALFLRRHHRLADCTTRRVTRLRITSEAKVPYQLDGDPGGFLPLDVEVLPGYLTLVVPRKDEG